MLLVLAKGRAGPSTYSDTCIAGKLQAMRYVKQAWTPLLLTATLLASCGGSTRASAACNGLPRAARPPVGGFALRGELTKRDLCKWLGNPRSISTGADGAQLWTYQADVPTVTLRNDRVIKIGGRDLIPPR